MKYFLTNTPRPYILRFRKYYEIFIDYKDILKEEIELGTNYLSYRKKNIIHFYLIT